LWFGSDTIHGYLLSNSRRLLMAQPKNFTRYRSLRIYWAPQYWVTWLTLGLMWLIAHLPFSMQIKFGQGLGLMTLWFARKRRHICEINLRLCYPTLNDIQLKQLVRKTFISSGIGLIEVAIAWYREPSDFKARVTTTGLENLTSAINRGKGVLLICAHFTTIEMGGFLSNLFFKMHYLMPQCITEGPDITQPLSIAKTFAVQCAASRKDIFCGTRLIRITALSIPSLFHSLVSRPLLLQQRAVLHVLMIRQSFSLAIIEMKITQGIICISAQN